MKKIILSCLALFLVFYNLKGQISCLEHDSLELVKIYEDCGGENWTNTWDLDAPVSTWYRVFLSPDGCNVEEISVSNNNLAGAFPDIDLQNLTILSLSENQLTGIPNFSNLPSLTGLSLQDNLLTSIPDFSNSSFLEVLHVDYNMLDFSGLYPFVGFYAFTYSFQDSIELVQVDSSTLSFPVGGNLAHNSFWWYRNGLFQAIIDEDNTYVAQSSGTYRCVASNSVLTDLSLYSKEFNLSLSPNYLENDSLELVKIYNDCGGPFWTNTWDLNAPMSSWYGVSFNGSGVYEINLPNNNLTGNFPDIALQDLVTLSLSENLLASVPDFSYLPSLGGLGLYNNRLTSIPSFSNSPLLEVLSLDHNNLDFSDLYPFIGLYAFTYSFQDSLELVPIDSSTLSFPVGGNLAHNTYTWYRYDVPVDTLQGDSVFIAEYSGVYHCKATNSILTDLTINSKEIYLDIYSPLKHDSLELLKIYNDCGGSNWKDVWNLNMPVSTWEGVVLTDDGFAVEELRFNSNYLTGFFPDIELEKLSILNLSNNTVASIPDFSNLNNLIELNLGNNQLTSIPDFSNLANLTELNLCSNQLTSIPDFSNLDELTELDLCNNQLTSIPDFSNLDKLTQLLLFDNQLTSIPDFSTLYNITTLRLSSNQLTSIPDFSNLDELTFLSLTSNQLISIPDFSNLGKLRSLLIDRNQLTSVPDFSNLSELEILSLEFNQLTSVPDFSNLNKLKYFYINENKLISIPDFSNLNNLTDLYLSENQLTSVPNFSKLDNLIILELFSNQLTSVPNFNNLNSLSVINLGRNRLNFSDLIPFENILGIIQPLYPTAYSPQDSVTLQSIDSTTLSFPANNVDFNTYTWYMDDLPYFTSQDSTFEISGPGRYRCEATNLFFPDLTLYSKELFVCEGVVSNSNVDLYPLDEPTCKGDLFRCGVFGSLANIDRYRFFVNGVLLQDSILNDFRSTDLEHGDIVHAIVKTTDDCQYYPENTDHILIDLEPEPQLRICQTDPSEFQIKLTQGTTPWEFELKETTNGLVNTASYSPSSNSIIITRNPESQYEITSLQDANCSASTIAKIPEIRGCQAVCVGYSQPQVEIYSASFYKPVNPGSINWEIFPFDAALNGDITIVNQNNFVIELDFSNALPIYEQITLRATAETECGIEILELPIKLDKECVWPGDVNKDGQVIVGQVNSSWVDDAIGLYFAIEEQEAILNNINNDVLLNQTRQAGCLADETWEWEPQSAKDWIIESATGIQSPAIYEIKDNNGVVTASLNLKYADCNGDGFIRADSTWDSMNTPFEALSYRSDYDILTYHAIQGNSHNYNSPALKMDNMPELLHISTQDSVYQNGDEIVFSVSLGDSVNVVNDVVNIAFAAEGSFGSFGSPSISLAGVSHLSYNPEDKIDYPVNVENWEGNLGDSLNWYVSIQSSGQVPKQFNGDPVCNAICHVTIIHSFDDTPSNSKNQGNSLQEYATQLHANPNTTDSLGVPISIKIPNAGIALADGKILPVQSNEITLYIKPEPRLTAKVFLEGAFEDSTGLMRDQLRTMDLIPTTEPYSSLPSYYFKRAEVEGISLKDRATVLATTGEAAIVDWVFIEIRALDSTLVASRPALVTRSGNVVDIDGISPLPLPRVPYGDYFIVIRHRNHLPVMTTAPVYFGSEVIAIDFTQIESYRQKELQPGVYGLYAGDATCEDHNCVDGYDINGEDKSRWYARNGLYSVYDETDFDMNSDVNGQDRILWTKNVGTNLNVPR